MEPAVHLGLELPPVGAAATGAGIAMAKLTSTAAAAARAGFGTVWLQGTPGRGGQPAADPCTLAAGLGAVQPGVGLGVVWDGPDDRHPAVLAREVTALDIVTGGRAAVLLRWDAEADDAALEYLLEAAAVCRLVFVDERPTFEGRAWHVAGAVNRPAPVRAVGPPILVTLPTRWWSDALLGKRLRGAAHLLASATAVVCPFGADALGPWQDALDRLRSEVPGGGPWPSLVWRPSGEQVPAAAPGGVIVPLAGWDVDEVRALAERWAR